MSIMQSTAGNHQTRCGTQTGQLLSIVPEAQTDVKEEPFADNYEYLASLEKEALLMLLHAAIRSGKMDWPANDGAGNRLYSALGLPAEKITQQDVESALTRTREINKTRQIASFRIGTKLSFSEFCRENQLDDSDEKIFLLLVMNVTSELFRETFSLCNFAADDRGIKIRVILSILCAGYRETLDIRKHFSRSAPLVSREIIFFRNAFEIKSPHVTDLVVTTNERHIRYVSGDHYIYESTCDEISIEQSTVELENVIMPGHIKKQITSHVDQYLRQRESALASRLDDFFGYGTALTLFFQGPSGTGKTMMARALAHYFNRHLISVNLGNTHYNWELESIMVQAFREAALMQGFVFFDEADDLFIEGSYLARSLLIQLEKAKCVVIFATNKASRIDPAMERRLCLKIHFPLPDAAERLKIWRASLPDFVDLAKDVNLKELSERYSFSGGLIKNTVFLAVNAAAPDAGGRPVITYPLLEKTALLQASQMRHNKYSRIYLPEKRIDDLFLAEKKRVELKRVAEAFRYSQNQGRGLNVMISGNHIETGISAAEALAGQCGLKVKAVRFSDMGNVGDENKIVDMITQEKTNLMDYTFCRTTEEAHLLLIVDHNDVIDWQSTENQDDMDVNLAAGRMVTTLLNNLRDYQGFCCLVMHECPRTGIPLEFHAHFQLDYPPEEMQIGQWEKYLATGTFHDGDLIELVERNPMHIAEIDSIIHRASIQSLVEGKARQSSLETVKTVIARYRGKNKTPVLFGGK